MKAVTTAQRAQELRKFFAPYDPSQPEPSSLNERIYNDGVLQSIAESLMWKLGASRAMVSLVDKDTQYFLAGSTREEEDPESNQRFWFGRSSTNVGDGFCSDTLMTTGEDPIFSVKNLSRDARFEKLPIVNGSVASLRFYAGIPIRTDRTITIGTLYVVDDKPREAGLSDQQEKFLVTSTNRVMRYLEVAREAATRPRLSLMSRGIAKFLETKAQIVQDIARSRMAREASDQAQKQRDLDSSQGAAALSRKAPSILNNHADQVERTFQLAAKLLKESFDISDGGVAFYDTVTGFDNLVTTSRKTGWTSGSSYSSSTEPMDKDVKNNTKEGPEIHIVAEPEQEASTKSTNQSRPRTKSDLLRPVKLIARVSHEEGLPEVLDIKTMESLINRYPDGTVWYFDNEGFFSSSLEQEEMIRNFPTVALAVEDLAKEAFAMSKSFSGTRQLIFLPLWDYVAKRWCSTCLIWSHSSFPVFTADCEVVHLSAFTNSVMSEISRLDAIAADQIKGEFIGSMSHEFRSPLHGILASAEFLNDNDHNRSESLLISTIHNCGRTLLDTVNHLLDYSRLDSLNKELLRNIGTTEEFVSNPLYCVTNIAALCEEVIDGMIMSSGFEDITEPDPHGLTARTMSLMSHMDPLPSRIDQISLPVMLEMENRNWSFYTQPGAIRRILMNIFGNSIKYTKSGFIRVTLASEETLPLDAPMDANVRRAVLKLTVEDSGRGMSPEFLEKSLYTPFIQENILAPGVGLGLSIVRNIVDQLGGTIKVESEVGVGTSVEVRLPLDTDSPTSPGQLIQASIDDEYFGAPSQIAQEKVIALRRSPVSKTPVTRTSVEEKKATTSELVARYLVDWLDFKVIIFDDWTDDIKADVVIVEEHEESEPFMDLLGLPGMPPILVICNLASCVENGRTKLPDGIAGFISIPVGPRKLAKVLFRHFKRMPASPAQMDTLTRTFQANLQVKGSTINLQDGGLDTTFEGLLLRGKLGALDVVGLRSKSASTILTTTPQAVTLDTSKLQVEIPTQVTRLHASGSNCNSDSSPPPLLLASSTSSTSPRSTSNSSPPSLLPEKSTSSSISTSNSIPPSLPPTTSTPSSNSTHFSTPPPSLPTASFAASSSAIPTKSICTRRPALLTASTTANIHPLKPIPRPKTQTYPLSPELTSTTIPDSSRPPLKILAVDDNEINLALIRRYLEKRTQDTVHYARNGLEALEKVKHMGARGQGGYDVVFMDLNMPVMDGFESVRRIREFEAEAKIEFESSSSTFANFLSNRMTDDTFSFRPNTDISAGNGIRRTSRHELSLAEEDEEASAATNKNSCTGEIDGNETQPKVKVAQRCYVIALTGLSAERDRKEAVKCGIDAFLTKPVRFRNVGRILEERCWVKAEGTRV